MFCIPNRSWASTWRVAVTSTRINTSPSFNYLSLSLSLVPLFFPPCTPSRWTDCGNGQSRPYATTRVNIDEIDFFLKSWRFLLPEVLHIFYYFVTCFIFLSGLGGLGVILSFVLMRPCYSRIYCVIWFRLEATAHLTPLVNPVCIRSKAAGWKEKRKKEKISRALFSTFYPLHASDWHSKGIEKKNFDLVSHLYKVNSKWKLATASRVRLMIRSSIDLSNRCLLLFIWLVDSGTAVRSPMSFGGHHSLNICWRNVGSVFGYRTPPPSGPATGRCLLDSLSRHRRVTTLPLLYRI